MNLQPPLALISNKYCINICINIFHKMWSKYCNTYCTNIQTILVLMNIWKLLLPIKITIPILRTLNKKNLISNNQNIEKSFCQRFQTRKKDQNSIRSLELTCQIAGNPMIPLRQIFSNITNWSQMIGSENRYIWSSSFFFFNADKYFTLLIIFKCRQIIPPIFNLRHHLKLDRKPSIFDL